MKSILDLPGTLEQLETRGVLVAGYRTDVLPGFLTRSSGLTLEHTVDSPEAAAALVRATERWGSRAPSSWSSPFRRPMPSIRISCRRAWTRHSSRPEASASPGKRSRRFCSNRSDGPPGGKACAPTALAGRQRGFGGCRRDAPDAGARRRCVERRSSISIDATSSRGGPAKSSSLRGGRGQFRGAAGFSAGAAAGLVAALLVPSGGLNSKLRITSSTLLRNGT